MEQNLANNQKKAPLVTKEGTTAMEEVLRISPGMPRVSVIKSYLSLKGEIKNISGGLAQQLWRAYIEMG